MNSQTHSPSKPWNLSFSESSSQLGCVLEEYLQRLEAGEQIETQDFVAAYPEIAEELKSSIEKLQALQRIADGLDSSPAQVHAQLLSSAPSRLGDFVIYRELGRGGMGVVYEAEQLSLGRKVALKTLPLSSLLNDRRIARFKNESAAAASLDHPHIVAVYAVGCDGGTHYYAMQLIEGHSLAEVIEERRTEEAGAKEQQNVSVRQTETLKNAAESTLVMSCGTEFYTSVAKLGRQAAEALQYAHEQGVIHRDIKPSNLLVDRNGHVWVADFGLAATQTDVNLTRTGELLGTLRYMSPEQASGDQLIDHRADVYGLGATLYELLSGKPIIDAEEHGAALRELLADEPIPIKRLTPSVPKDLETVIMKATAREVDDRYSTARELAEDLERFLESRPVVARQPTVWRTGVSLIKRNRRLAEVSAVAFLALVTLAIGGPFVAIRMSSALQNERELSASLSSNQAQLRSQVYSQRIREALRAAKRSDYGPAEHVLKRYEPSTDPHAAGADVPDFEFHLLKKLFNANASRIVASNWIDVQQVACSPDGVLLAYGTWHGEIAILDRRTRKLLRRLQITSLGPGWINDLEFSPDSRLLMAVGGKAVGLWEVDTGRRIKIPQNPNREANPGRFLQSALLGGIQDGLFLAIGDSVGLGALQGRTQISLYRVVNDADTDISVQWWTELTGSQGSTDTLSVSANGQVLLAGGRDGRIRRWKLPDLTPLEDIQLETGIVRELHCHPLRSDLAAASTVQFAPERCSTHVYLLAHGVDEQDPALTQVLQELPLLHDTLRFSPDGSEFAVAFEDGQIWMWDVPSELGTLDRTVAHQFKAHVSAIHDLEFSHDGAQLYSAGADGHVREWPLPPSSSTQQMFPSRGLTNAIAWSTGGQYLAAAVFEDECLLRAWKVSNGELIAAAVSRGQNPLDICFLPNDQRILYATGLSASTHQTEHIGLWDPIRNTTQVLLEIPVSTGGVANIGISSNGKSVVATLGKTLAVLDASTLAVEYLHRFDSLIQSCVHPTENLVTITPSTIPAGDKAFLIWDLEQRRVIKRIEHQLNRVRNVAISKDGKQMAAFGGGNLHLWTNWRDPQKSPSVAIRQGGAEIWDAAFSPNGRRLATATLDGTVQLWSTVTRAELLTVATQAEWNYAVAFNPAGTMLAHSGGKGNWYGSVFLIDATQPESIVSTSSQ